MGPTEAASSISGNRTLRVTFAITMVVLALAGIATNLVSARTDPLGDYVVVMVLFPGIITCVNAWQLVRPRSEERPYALTRRPWRYLVFVVAALAASVYAVYFLISRSSATMLGIFLSALGFWTFLVLFDRPDKPGESAPGES